MPGKTTESWFLGIDLGTGSCKSVVVDERLYVIALGACRYNALQGQPEWEGQDPQALLDAVIQSVKNALEETDLDAARCAGISLGGALHSLVALDAKGQPLTRVLTWVESSASEQVRQVLQQVSAQDLYEETGCPPHSLYPLYKIRSLKENQPELFCQAASFVSAKEYVLSQLTGETVVDYAIAAGSGLLDTHKQGWSQMALDLCGITPQRLSTLASPETEVGQLKSEAASRMGLPAGVPVILGSADAVNSSLGAGAVRQTQATCMIGTSGALRVISPQPLLDMKRRTWCYAIDAQRWLVGGAINNGGLPLSWLVNTINAARPNGDANRLLSFSELLELAGQVKPGSEGLICLPFLTGERSPNWNMNARGVFFGLTDRHHLGHVTRSILEGVAYRLRSVQDALQAVSMDIQEMRISGGFTRSELWVEIVASVLKQPLLTLECGETSALGAAAWALYHFGVLSSLEELSSVVRVKRLIAPNPLTADLYSSGYLMYQKLYERLKDLFDEVAEGEDDLSR